MLLRDGKEEGLIFIAQLASERKLCPLAEKCFAIVNGEIYRKVCSDNHEFCMSFSEKKPVSKEDYESGNYVIEFVKKGNMFAVSGVA